MCATCGCSDDSGTTLTDLQSGETIALAPIHAHQHGPGERNDHHHHGHGHHHDHQHEHRHHEHGGGTVVTLEQQVLARNDGIAQRVRGWLAGRGVVALNLVSSPGAGKTTLLERSIRDLGSEFPLSVIEGDQQTLNDARRIQAAGCRVVQVNTGTACHLDASMVARALQQLDPPGGSFVMIENVGNLVCPALFDLGEWSKVVVASVTEGDDKPLKYPHMFRASGLMVLNKIDLLPHVEFDVDRCIGQARQVNPRIEVLKLSATTGDGLVEWYGWLRRQAERLRERSGLI
jgi:hydrogenase nickel incorporation protein HypB